MPEEDANVQKDWIEALTDKSAKNDKLKRSDRYGQIIGIACVVLMSIFFAYHLTRPTGFFTGDFGALGATLFFGAVVFGILPQAIRFITGRKNPARLFDIVGSVITLIAMIYFLSTFPFDFSHFADPLPASLEGILNWVSNDLAKGLLTLGIIGMLIATPIQVLILIRVREIGSMPDQKVVENPPAPEEAPKEPK